MPKPTSADGEPLQSVLSAPGLDVFAWKNVLVSVWKGGHKPEVLSVLGQAIDTRVREVGPVSSVNIVLRVPVLPSEEERRAYKAFAERHVGKLAHVAIVLDGEGFLISAIRALITSLLILTRVHSSVAVVNNVEQVTQWLPAKHLASTGVGVDARELRDALEQAIARATAA